MFPFHGAGSADELNFGGTGPYAGLLNLLAIAEGPIVDGGQVVLHGRPTHRFSAQVQELKLTRLLPPKERVALLAATPPQRLEVFIDEGGLPVRVVLTEVGKNGSFATTTELLAVNIPVLVTAPSRRRTRLAGSSGAVSVSVGRSAVTQK